MTVKELETLAKSMGYYIHKMPENKGHGRLIDADALNSKDVNFASKVLVREEIANKCPVIMKFIEKHKVRNVVVPEDIEIQFEKKEVK